jgi:hypothetical protein
LVSGFGIPNTGEVYSSIKFELKFDAKIRYNFETGRKIVYLCGEISQASNIKEYGIKRKKASMQTNAGFGMRKEQEVESAAFHGRNAAKTDGKNN